MPAGQMSSGLFMQTIRSSVYAGIPFSRITQKCRPQTLLKDTAVFPVPYYTIDYAELVDGTWKILEAGDGSVSGLSPRQEPAVYYRALYNALSGRVFDTENTAQ